MSREIHGGKEHNQLNTFVGVYGGAPQNMERNMLDELMAIMVDLPPHEQNNYWLEVREQLLKIRYNTLERLKEERQSIESQIISYEQVINDFK